MAILNFNRLATAMTLILAVAVTAMAQRKITPVDNPQLKGIVTAKPETADGDEAKPKRPESVVEQTDLQGRIVLVDTVTGREYTDTVLLDSPKRIYPTLHAVSVGVNVWDIAARAFGNDYGLVSVWAELSLHNWLKPYVEFGVGSADHMARDDAFRYKSSTAPFFKVGMNYNFLYNSNPHYSVYAGVRLGYTSFSYEITEGSTSSGYWDETMPVNVPRQSTSALYFEGLAGVRVYIAANIYLGWEVKYHSMLHQKSMLYGNPWYIPGYGTRGSTFAASFSVSYTLPLHKEKSDRLPPGAEPAPQ